MNDQSLLFEEKLINSFHSLSEERKVEAIDFITFLKIKEEIEATKEIIEEKDFLESIMKGDKDFQEGRYKKWSEVIEDV